MGNKIGWCDITWNPVTGCTPVSPACANCWAKRMARRLAGRFGYPEAPDYFNVTLHPDRLIQPMLLVKPKRIFVVSMGDLFHEDVPDSYIATVFDVAMDADRHTYQFLTKRAERMARFTKDYCLDRGLKRLPPHMWGLVTTEDQENANKRIPWLLRSLFWVRGISCEPLLSEIDLTAIPYQGDTKYYLNVLSGRYSTVPHSYGNIFAHGLGNLYPVNFVIVGGESGPGARPMHPNHARSLRNQCVEARAPFFFKQHGEWAGIDQVDHLVGPGQTWEDAGLPVPRERVFDDGTICVKVGKERAGYLLDGVEWKQFPGEAT